MPTSPTSEVQPSPFENIHYRYETSRKTPYLGFYYVQKLQKNNKLKSVPVRKRFKTPEERDVWAREVAATLQELGRKTKALDTVRAARWAIADELLEPHEDPVEVVNFYRQQHPRTSGINATRSPLCSKVLAEYIEHRRTDPDFPISQYRSIYERFNAQFGALHVEQFANNIHDFEDWVNNLPFADRTKLNHFSRIRVAFRWAFKRSRTDRNPFARAEPPKPEPQDIEIIQPDELIKLYAANYHLPGICAKIALSVQAGMRTEAVARVEYRDIQFEEQAIETPAWKTKKKRRQLIQGLPQCVWDWVERAKPEDFAAPCQNARSKEHVNDWKVRCKTAWMHEKSKAIERAGLSVPKSKEDPEKGIYARSLPRNWARHTFVTCHATHFENLPLTAELVSHALDVATIKQNYLGVVRKKAAARLFEITPTLVESFAKKDNHLAWARQDSQYQP